MMMFIYSSITIYNIHWEMKYVWWHPYSDTASAPTPVTRIVSMKHNSCFMCTLTMSACDIRNFLYLSCIMNNMFTMCTLASDMVCL